MFNSDEDSPSLKSSILIGPTKFSFGAGAERSAPKSLVFNSDEEFTTDEDDIEIEDEQRD